MGKKRINRRSFLKGLTAAAAGVGAAAAMPRFIRSVRPARADTEKQPRFLIVLGGFGGASIIDSFLAIRESESNNPLSINCFPDQDVVDISGSPLRAAQSSGGTIGALPFAYNADQSEFVNKHKADMLVATATGTSVNHAVGQAAVFRCHGSTVSVPAKSSTASPARRPTACCSQSRTPPTTAAWCSSHPKPSSAPSI